MPLLTRMVGTPLAIDIGAGAVGAPRAAAGRPADLQRRPRRGRRRARAGRGDRRRCCARSCANAEICARSRAAASRRRPSWRDAAARAASTTRWSGIGGGRTLDVAKYAAQPVRAADGRGRHQPRPRRHRLARRLAGGRRPQGLLRRADADRGGGRPRLRAPQRAGACGAPGSATRSRNLSAIADWRLAERERGEPVDGVAVTFARTAATSILHRDDGIDDDDVPDRAGRGARAVRAGDGDRRARAGRAAAATTRSCTRSTTSSRAPRTTASWPARRALFTCVPARRRRPDRARSTPACAATGCRALPADLGLTDGAVRRGRRARAATRGRTATRSSSTSSSTTRRRVRATRVRTRIARRPSIAELRAVDAAAVDLRPQQRRALGGPAVHAARSRRT